MTVAGADAEVEGGFGRVSRTKGIVFKYGLLAATLVGILSLAVLLVYVALDAFQPFAADPGWWLAYFLLLVVPGGATLAYVARRSAAATGVGLATLGLPIAGAMVGAGVSVLFIEIVAISAWLGVALGVALGAGVTALHRRLRSGAGFYERLGVTAVAFVGALAVVPPAVAQVPVIPSNWIIVLLTLALPVAGGVGYVVAERYESTRAGYAAAGLTFLAAFVGANVAPLAGTAAFVGVVLGLSVTVPTGAYVGTVLHERPDLRAGLLLPVVVVLGALAGAVAVDALGFAGPASWLDWQFLTSDHSRFPDEAGIYPALVGSVMLMIIVALMAFPVGVGAAVYLEEYAPDNRWTRAVQVNISNLAGVPSVVYGLLGLGIFINIGGLKDGSLLVGGITLGLLILPIVIISSQEAIRSVPDSLREASYGMGATRWQTVRNVVLPRAIPGILTGTILALGRAIGETAPLIMIGAPSVAPIPHGLTDTVSAMPMQVYAWATVFASDAFYTTALAAGVVTMLVVLLSMNSIAIVLRNRYQREG